MKKSLIYFAVAVAYMAVIFIYSSLPQESQPPAVLGLDIPSMITHMAAYFVLSLLLAQWLMKRGSPLPFMFIMAVLIASVYGVTDEIHQAFVPTRYCSAWDMLSNFFGSILIAPIVIKLHMSKHKLR